MQLSLRLGLRIVTIGTIIISIVLMVSLFTTTPDSLGPFGITLWFVGLLMAFGGISTLVLYYLKRSLSHQDKQLAFTSSLRQGVLLSTLICGMFALASLHQLDIKDIVLISSLVVLIEFYLRRL